MTTEITRYRLRITFTEPLLGSVPLNADVYTDFVASKAQPVKVPTGKGTIELPHLNGDAATEVATVADLDIKGRTGFHRDADGKPYLYNYTVKGFLKEAWRALRQQKKRLSTGLTNGVSKIDTQIFVSPRLIPLHVTRPVEVDVLERPLRAQTAMGPRVALASSEMLPAQTWFDCELDVLLPDAITEDLLAEWFGYGRYLGMGQWRSGGFGTFSHTLRRIE